MIPSNYVVTRNHYWYDGDFYACYRRRILYNMVRAITGTLVQVGRGRMTADQLAAVLSDGTRDDAGETAPACGLYLMRVEYDEQTIASSDLGSA